MTEMPQEIANIIKSGDLRPLKVFCTLYRNKWNAGQGKFETEAEGIDISGMISKSGTLSKTLDIGEINRFETNNVTLTLSDPKGLFTEGADNSLFNGDYQLYGSKAALFVGISPQVKTQLFTGIVKELPIYKPDEYKLELRLVSPLEFLRDIETKDFSDKITGETLTLDHQEEEENSFYKTAQTGVGGIEAVYANGVKLFEGVDYEISQTNELSSPAIIEIVNADLFGQTFTADYFTWKRNLTVEEVVTGLLTMSGYPADKLQIQSVTWGNIVRNEIVPNVIAALDYKKSGGNNYIYSGDVNLWQNGPKNTLGRRTVIFPNNFIYSSVTILAVSFFGTRRGVWAIGDINEEVLNSDPLAENIINNGVSMVLLGKGTSGILYVRENNNTLISLSNEEGKLNNGISIKKIGDTLEIYYRRTGELAISIPNANNILKGKQSEVAYSDYTWTYAPSGKFANLDILNEDGSIIATLDKPGILTEEISLNSSFVLADFNADLSESSTNYSLQYRTKKNNTWSNFKNISIGIDASQNVEGVQYLLTLEPPTAAATSDINNISMDYLSNKLTLQFVNLDGQTVLDAIEDFALISGYEFGLDRLGNFFFRPRLTSNIPTAVLDGTQLVKIGNIQKKLNNFFTKLVLLFGATPLEFYANEGEKPTLIDRYGVLTKEIDRPQIVNYDNPELAQAIGPQLLSVYSSLKNQISAMAKLNLSLDLGDIINLKRELPLTVNPQASDFTKYESLNTYYRACKIIGLSYDFDKRQVKYTLQDVSDNNTKPLYEFNEFKYLLPVELGVKE